MWSCYKDLWCICPNMWPSPVDVDLTWGGWADRERPSYQERKCLCEDEMSAIYWWLSARLLYLQYSHCSYRSHSLSHQYWLPSTTKGFPLVVRRDVYIALVPCSWLAVIRWDPCLICISWRVSTRRASWYYLMWWREVGGMAVLRTSSRHVHVLVYFYVITIRGCALMDGVRGQRWTQRHRNITLHTRKDSKETKDGNRLNIISDQWTTQVVVMRHRLSSSAATGDKVERELT